MLGTPLSEFDQKVVEIISLDLPELSTTIQDQRSRNQVPPKGNQMFETCLGNQTKYMLDVRSRSTDLGIRSLGDLMMLNPILRSKMVPGRCQTSKIEETNPKKLEKKHMEKSDVAIPLPVHCPTILSPAPLKAVSLCSFCC